MQYRNYKKVTKNIELTRNDEFRSGRCVESLWKSLWKVLNTFSHIAQDYKIAKLKSRRKPNFSDNPVSIITQLWMISFIFQIVARLLTRGNLHAIL